ncbi:MAG TPA: hypothetical protein VI111_05565 [Thermoleophilaceae bacterium]
MSTNRDSADAGINRRRFVRGAGATAAGIAIAAAGADALLDDAKTSASAQVPPPALDPEGLLKAGDLPVDHVLEGDIVSLSPQSMVIHPLDSSPVRVDLAANANVNREGPVPLSAYSPGEEVVVLGNQRGDHFEAVGVAAMFRSKEATLYSREGPLLHTSDGEIMLTPNTRPRGGLWAGKFTEARALAELKAGDRIIVVGLLNQKTGVMAASSISVEIPNGGDRPPGP